MVYVSYYREMVDVHDILNDEQKEEAQIIIDHYLRLFKNNRSDYEELGNRLSLRGDYEREMKGVHKDFIQNQLAELYLKKEYELTNNGDYYLLFKTMYNDSGQKYKDY